MEYRYHPEIEGLKVNEDGSSVLLNETPVVVKVRKSGNNPFRYIYLKQVIGLARLVLECWGGISDSPKASAKHKDGDYTNYHYSNLEWGKWGGNPKYEEKHRFVETNKMKIYEAVKSGRSFTDVAKEFGTNRTTVSKIYHEIENQ